MVLDINFTAQLIGKKNLLAFSGGTDSSALAHALQMYNIPFDIAIVNYGTRKESDLEEEYATRLAKSIGCRIYVKKVSEYELPKNNFEAEAREIRYRFFEGIIQEYGYENLVTGHNLNDKVEWFLMQFTKGAGTKELFGMDPVSKKEGYSIVRPLIDISKDTILEYLQINDVEHYYDKSNDDEKYLRNKFRHKCANALVSEYENGIRRTFDILAKETAYKKIEIIHRDDEVVITKYDGVDTGWAGDRTAKLFGYVMSKEQREDFAKTGEFVFKIDRFYVMSLYKDKIIITPYLQNTKMDKPTKEMFRKKGIPVKNRPFLSDKYIYYFDHLDYK